MISFDVAIYITLVDFMKQRNGYGIANFIKSQFLHHIKLLHHILAIFPIMFIERRTKCMGHKIIYGIQINFRFEQAEIQTLFLTYFTFHI